MLKPARFAKKVQDAVRGVLHFSYICLTSDILKKITADFTNFAVSTILSLNKLQTKEYGTLYKKMVGQLYRWM